MVALYGDMVALYGDVVVKRDGLLVILFESFDSCFCGCVAVKLKETKK